MTFALIHRWTTGLRAFLAGHARAISTALRVTAALVLCAWISATYWYAAFSLPLPNIACPQDLGLMLDAGWRYYQGLRPHADYHSPMGPVLGIVFGLPMRLFGPSYSSLQFLPPTLSAVAALWTWVVCGRALSPWLATFTSIAMGAITGGLYHLGFPPEALTFATIYNRIGFGVLGVVALAAMLPRTESDARHNRFMDSSVVVGILVLAFLKANFAVAAVPFALWCAFAYRRTRADWIFLAAVSGIVTLFFLYQIGFRIDRMWGDLLLASRVRREGVGLVFFPSRNALANYDFFLILALNSALWLPRYEPGGNSWKRSLVAMSAIWGSTFIGLFLSVVSSHGDGRGISLMLVAAAASTAWLAHFALDDTPPRSLSATVRLKSDFAGVTTAMIAMLFIVPHAQAYWFWRQVSGNPGPPQFPPGPLRSLYVGNITNTLGPDCVPKMNEAIDLLSMHCKPPDSLQYAGFNTYTFAAGLRSPKDSVLFWDTVSTYSRDHHPPASDFWDTDFILVPQHGLGMNDTTDEWMSVYGYHVLTHYDTCGETTFFKLYKHKKPATGQTEER